MPTKLSDLISTEQYLEASEDAFKRVLGELPSNLCCEQPRTQLRFHHLHYHADGRPMVRELAHALADNLIQFCLSERRYQRPQAEMTVAEAHEMTTHLQTLGREARSLLRRVQNGGEAGELLLYFLMEIVLKAPQVVCKMELKGNPKTEVLGSDGIHLRWDPTSKIYDVYFGEAKLEKKVTDAVAHAAASISKFHRENRRDTEIRLVTANFKYLDPAGQAIAAQLAHSEDYGAGLRTNHACLIGYNSEDYLKAVGEDFRAMQDDFIRSYAKVVPRMCKLVVGKFQPLVWTCARFEIFLLPFPAVAEFRKAFNRAINPDE